MIFPDYFSKYITDTGVTFVRPEMQKYLPEYQMIADCIAGQRAVKARRERYLPDPSGVTCPENEKKDRYNSYIHRAIFFNAVRPTLNGLVGEVFAKKPEIELPEGLEPILESASGDGTDLEQQAKKTLECVLSTSRAGLLVDYPNTGDGLTKAEAENHRIQPTITLYEATQIRNWQTKDDAAEEVLTLLVLLEEQEVAITNSDFAVELQPWFRVYRLKDNAVTVEIWKPKKEGIPINQNVQSLSSIHFELAVPPTLIKDREGNPLKRIPFVFIGLLSNKALPEAPAFSDISYVNIGHYCNSADYEENVFIVGQATLTANELPETWVNDVLKGGIRLGARQFLPLPRGSKAEFLQATPNTIIVEAMREKERQMQSLGAKLVEEGSVQRTATEARIDSTAEGSVLRSAARNVSAGYRQALTIAAQFVKNVEVTDENLVFRLNDSFDMTKLTAQDIQQIIAAWLSGATDFSEMRAPLRAAGYATKSDDEVMKSLQEEADNDLENEVKRNDALGVENGNQSTID